ncbi:twin-arginine translocase TatA/TatE family subunit [Streptococcus sp. E17BB]|uniref:twin-arginine translocase TatA/TatE family subunit n=1 Tax=Streptococcus sp. E17BB TaxID=3278714 RepID=UPI00359CBE8C
MGLLRDIGAPGVLVIVIAALIIFGPQKLPELGASIGKMITEFKKAVSANEDENQENK